MSGRAGQGSSLHSGRVGAEEKKRECVCECVMGRRRRRGRGGGRGRGRGGFPQHNHHPTHARARKMKMMDGMCRRDACYPSIGPLRSIPLCIPLYVVVTACRGPAVGWLHPRTLPSAHLHTPHLDPPVHFTVLSILFVRCG